MAVLMCSMDYVISRVFPLQVPDVDNFVSREIAFLQELLRFLQVPVIRIIIDEHYMIICVLLVHYRQHCAFVTVVLHVVAAWHCDTERQFLFPIPICVINFVVVLTLSLRKRMIMWQKQQLLILDCLEPLFLRNMERRSGYIPIVASFCVFIKLLPRFFLFRHIDLVVLVERE